MQVRVGQCFMRDLGTVGREVDMLLWPGPVACGLLCAWELAKQRQLDSQCEDGLPCTDRYPQHGQPRVDQGGV